MALAVLLASPAALTGGGGSDNSGSSTSAATTTVAAVGSANIATGTTNADGTVNISTTNSTGVIHALLYPHTGAIAYNLPVGYVATVVANNADDFGGTWNGAGPTARTTVPASAWSSMILATAAEAWRESPP